jgi:hypothetical protein
MSIVGEDQVADAQSLMDFVSVGAGAVLVSGEDYTTRFRIWRSEAQDLVGKIS